MHLLKPQGDLLRCGILENEIAELIDTYSKYFVIQSAKKQQEWLRLHLKPDT